MDDRYIDLSIIFVAIVL